MVDRSIQPRLHISNVISQMAAVAGGAGLGVLPHFMARNTPTLTRVLPDEVQLTRSYWLITHPDTHDLARIRACSDFLVDQVQQHGTRFWMDRAQQRQHLRPAPRHTVAGWRDNLCIAWQG